MRSFKTSAGFASIMAAVCTLAGTQLAHAQVLETPAPSPHARVEQRVGLTDFAIDYSSPAVKGRKIWGTLVPYDQPWRMGANSATKLIASRDFTFGGQAVKAGTYSLYCIPSKTSWQVILGANAEVWGTEVADKSKVVAQTAITPTALPASRERMIFLFTDTNDDGANLDLEWERVRVRVPIKVDTKQQVSQAIEKGVGDAWRPHFAAARYLLESGGDLDRALSYVDKSISIQETWWNQWIRSQIEAKKGNKAEAKASAEKAQKLGAGDRVYEGFFKDEIAKAVAGK